MKTLIQKIQTELQAEVDLVRGRDVFLSPDPDLIPEHVKLPCIGIKDGQVTRSELMGGCTEKTLPVSVIVYARLLKDEETIVTVFDIAEAVVEALSDNLLDGYVREMSTGNESPIQLMVIKDGFIIRKMIMCEYTKEDRP